MKIDLGKVAVANPTPCSIALVELIRTMEMIDQMYGGVRGRFPTDDEDRRISQLENRREALEAQIRREVAEKLGVDYEVLWQAVTG